MKIMMTVGNLIKFFVKIPIRAIRCFRDWIIPTALSWWVNLAFKFVHNPVKHKLPSKLIVSLTSYPARFEKLHLTLKCLLRQSIAPDKLILWVAHNDKGALTQEIFELINHGLEIRFCDDLRSYKKIIPTLVDYPDSFVVTADDDLYYWPSWLEELVCEFRNDFSEVVGHRAHRIRLGVNNSPLPYVQWDTEIKDSEFSILNFQTSGAGVLYPPGAFHSEVLEVKIFNQLCPKADDIWLYWMTRLNDCKLRRVKAKPHRLYCWPSTQISALWHSNVSEAGNDGQIKAMIDVYGPVYLETLSSRL